MAAQRGEMTTTMALSVLVGMLVFWAVGAYNRLVRLRSEAVKAFSALDSVVAVQPALIKVAQPVVGAALGPGARHPAAADVAAWSRLEAAAAQFALALANARARPLEPEPLRAFSTAYGVLTSTWRTPEAECLDAAVSPQDLRARLAGLDEQAVVHAAVFDAAVAAYNLAIRQFPAMILAAIWQFNSAEFLDWNRPVV